MSKKRLKRALTEVFCLVIIFQVLAETQTIFSLRGYANFTNINAEEQLPITKDIKLTLTSRAERLSDMLYSMIDNKGNKIDFPVFINSSTGIYDKEFDLGTQADDREGCVQNINGRRTGTCEDGIYSFDLQAVDAAGNVGEKLSNVKFERDTVKPERPDGKILPDLRTFKLNLSVSGEVESTAIVDTSARDRSWHKEQKLDSSGQAIVENLAERYWYSDTEYTVKLSLKDRAENVSEVLELRYRTPRAIGSGGGSGSESSPWGNATIEGIINGRRFPMVIKIDENGNATIESFTIPEPVLTYTSTDFSTGDVTIYGVALNKNYSLPVDAIIQIRTKTLSEAAAACDKNNGINIKDRLEVYINLECLSGFLGVSPDYFLQSYSFAREVLCVNKRISILPDTIDKKCLEDMRLLYESSQSFEIPLENTEIKLFRTNRWDGEVTLQRKCDVGAECFNNSARYWNDATEGRFIFGYNSGILSEGDTIQAKLVVYGDFPLEVSGREYNASYSYGVESGLSNELVVKKKPSFVCEESPYKLPWPGGTSHYVTQDPQNNDEGSTHSPGDYNNQWAYDFDHSFGSTVNAVADGKVVKVAEHWLDRDPNYCSISYINEGNYVVIDHGNGDVTLYLHLRQNSVLVDVNEYVRSGQLIAYVGSSGYVCGYHLHFTNQDSSTIVGSGFGASTPMIFSDASVCNPRYQGMPKYNWPEDDNVWPVTNRRRDSFISDNY